MFKKLICFFPGKRLCAGETFSRQNMWLLLSGLLQNFTFTVPKGQKLPSKDLKGGLHQTGPELWFMPIPRK